MALAAEMSMSGGLGWRVSCLEADLILVVGLDLRGSGSSIGLGFSRLEFVVAGVGGGGLSADGNFSGGMLGTVDTLLDVCPECGRLGAADEARESRVLVVVVEKNEIGLRPSKESMRPLDDLTSTAATGGGT